MKPSIRPSTPDDAPAIAALLTEVLDFGRSRAATDPLQLHWKYWQERPDWSGSRSFVLVRGTEVLAHAGVVPGSCAWGAEHRRVIHVIDWAARPGAVGAGIVIMKHIGRLTDILLAIGGSAHTVAILPTLGFVPYGKATRYVRPLRLSLPVGAALQRHRLVPRVLRSLLRPLIVPAVDRALRLRPIAPGALASIDLPLPRPTPILAVLERSAATFAHALACPTVPMTLHVIEQDDRVRGYCLLAFAPGQVRIVDCWIDSQEADDWRAVVHLAVREALRAPGATRLVTVASDPLLAQCLQESGFFRREAQRVQLLPTGRPGIPPMALRVQMLDDDAAYLHWRRGRFHR
jgi:hypothetical protein